MNADGTTVPPLPGDPPVPVDEAVFRPPVHRAAPSQPLRTRVGDRLWTWWRALPLPHRHRHFYRLIGATPKGLFPGVGPQTTLAFRCMCHTADQLLFVDVPGRWTVDDLTTPDWPPLISRARTQRLGELASVRELHGDDADALLDPVLPDWRHVAGELAAELAAGQPDSPAQAQYRQAVRIQAEADEGAERAAGRVDWAAVPEAMAAKMRRWPAPDGAASHD
jgi:hypothetical protein